MIFPDMAGVILVAMATFAMIYFVPKEKIYRHLPFGLSFGLGIAIILVILMQNVFGFWRFANADILHIYNIPLLISAAWIPTVIVYAHFLAKRVSFTRILILIGLFAMASVVIHYLLLANQMLIYENWNLFLTFSIAGSIHLAIAVYLYMIGHIKEVKG